MARDVFAPIELLTDPDLSAPAKILLLLNGIDTAPTDWALLSPSALAAEAGIPRSTVQVALAQLAELSRTGARSGSRRRGDRSGRSRAVVRIPGVVLTDGRIPPQARVIYGVLAHMAANDGAGRFTYSAVGEFLKLNVRTVRRAVQDLHEAGWVELSRTNHRTPVSFKLHIPVVTQSEREVALAKRRIDRAPFRGEAIMREYLSLIVDSDDFEDDAAPGFLVNPLTNERMQIDRFYPNASPRPVAFEFNGPQHYGETQLYSADESAAQQARDLMKAGICAQRGIALVVVHPQDLSLAGITAKVGDLLPQRTLPARTPLVEYLESVAAAYRRAARRGLSVPGRSR